MDQQISLSCEQFRLKLSKNFHLPFDSKTRRAIAHQGAEAGYFAEAGRRRSAAGALRHVLVDFAVFIRSRPETLHRGHDHARIELVDVFPRQSHAIERARRKILHQHVAMPDEPVENLLVIDKAPRPA